MTRLILVVLILAFAKLNAQLPDNVYNIVKTYPREYPSIQSLSYRIKNDFMSDRERAAAAYTWIALNISYDLKRYYSLRPSGVVFYNSKRKFSKAKADHYEKLAVDTFQSKKGLCEGYTALYTMVCSKLGLTSVSINGYTRNNVSSIGIGSASKNHTWNSVYYDNEWHLVDITRGAGKSISQQVWVSEFNNNFFDIQPEIFVKTHFPSDQNWQLIQEPISKQDFFSKPIYYSSLFKNDILISDSHVGEIKLDSNSNEIFIHFEKYPRNNELFFLIGSSGIPKKVKMEHRGNEKAIGKIKIKNNNSGILSLIQQNQIVAQFVINN